MSVEDDCNECEGWAQLDDNGRCAACASDVGRDPWEVVDREGAHFSGPHTRDNAETMARRLSFDSYGSPKYVARSVAA